MEKKKTFDTVETTASSELLCFSKKNSCSYHKCENGPNAFSDNNNNNNK